MAYEKNKTVWFYDNYDNLHTGTVTRTFKAGESRYLEVKLSSSSYGSMSVKEESCYPDRESCVAAREEKRRTRIAQIVSELETKDDLIRYMYSHTVSPAEEYTDWDAREAVRQKAMELHIALD